MRWAREAVRRARGAGRVPGRDDAVRAAYAAVLDGIHLWLAVPVNELTGELALRTEDDQLLTLADELAHDPATRAATERTGVRGVRVRLPEDTDGLFDVVMTTSGSVRPVALADSADTARSARTARATRPDRAQICTLEPADDGRLRVRVRPQPEVSVLLAATYDHGVATFSCSRPADAGERVHLLTRDDTVAATLPSRVSDDTLTVELAPEQCRLDAGPLLFAVEAPRAPIPVVRRDNLLPDPFEVPLPSVDDETGVLARLRFRPDGRLVLRPAPARTGAGR